MLPQTLDRKHDLGCQTRGRLLEGLPQPARVLTSRPLLAILASSFTLVRLVIFFLDIALADGLSEEGTPKMGVFNISSKGQKGLAVGLVIELDEQELS